VQFGHLLFLCPRLSGGLKKPAGEKYPPANVLRLVALATFIGRYGIDESDATGVPYPVTLSQPRWTASEESSPKPMSR
jgi:hypothetical protein